MAPTNRAAYVDALNTPLVVRNAPYTPPAANQVTIANHALAINPCDWGFQERGILIRSWPYILGCDVSGVVHAVGADVTHFKPGDRVLAYVIGINGGHPASGFQLYSNANAEVVTRIPDGVSFEEGAVLPLAVLTSASALYLEHYLGLDLPGEDAVEKDEYVFIWSGSSSVGATAIQLARHSGYKVVTTASPHNDKFCLDLGAEKVFDHHSDSIVQDVVGYLQGKTVAGIMDGTILPDVMEKCIEIARGIKGRKLIAKVDPSSKGEYEGGVTVVGTFAELRGTETAKKIYWDVLPQALASGKIRPKPDPQVVGRGLESLQAACQKLKAGVSATKIVVSL